MAQIIRVTLLVKIFKKVSSLLDLTETLQYQVFFKKP